jgi:hypothetical protein
MRNTQQLSPSIQLPVSNTVQTWIIDNKRFLLLIISLFIISLIFYQQPHIAMWIGFAIAGYSAIADDSIQTIGTFLSSNKHRPWWVLWLYIGAIMVAVLFWGWQQGDVAYGRLDRISQPQNFRYLQLAAPIILLIMTRLAMPVSTTFLLLSTFSDSKTIEAMVRKSLIGYIVAFVFAIILWTLVESYMNRKRAQSPDQVKDENANQKFWYAFQWISTGALWAVWLMQDAANVVVFLPRALSLAQIVVVIVFLLAVLAFIFHRGGGNIQQIVETKTNVKNVRSASIIDFFYAVILFIFKGVSKMPMSTTWVFLGLLAGREIAIAYSNTKDDRKAAKSRYQKIASIISGDLLRASLGMIVSIALALAINL